MSSENSNKLKPIQVSAEMFDPIFIKSVNNSIEWLNSLDRFINDRISDLSLRISPEKQMKEQEYIEQIDEHLDSTLRMLTYTIGLKQMSMWLELHDYTSTEKDAPKLRSNVKIMERCLERLKKTTLTGKRTLTGPNFLNEMYTLRTINIPTSARILTNIAGRYMNEEREFRNKESSWASAAMTKNPTQNPSGGRRKRTHRKRTRHNRKRNTHRR